MALYVIGDTHLSLGADKPMDVFGGGWTGYVEKLREGFSNINPEDTVVLCGDLSWGMSLEQARQDNAEAMFSGHDIPAEKAAAMQRFVQEVLQACRKKRNPLQRFADRWFHIWY